MTQFTYYLTEGSRIFFTSLKSRFFPQKYHGNAKEICQQVVDACWNGHFFQTSTNNFSQFWTRDFGWCCKSLLQLGYKKKVHQTLRYVLNRFQKYSQITTTLTPSGKPFDFPNSAVDSLPYLIHSIKISGFPYRYYKKFLNWQIRSFFEEFIDPLTGLVKPDPVSSMKDFAVRKSSCYDNVLVAMLAKDLKTMKLDNPFQKYNYPKLLKQHFWSGKYFFDDLSKQEYVAGDAQIFPFALGIIQDQEMLESAIQELQNAGLDQPIPLKFTSKEAPVKFIWQEWFLRNYERHSLWTHMGPFYIKLIKKTHPELAKKHKQSYTQMIEKYHNYLEVFSATKKQVKPFRTPFYFCDRGMLWAANYLTL
ncbi:hypothetical protein GOV03_02855 [Candidatus Woesearchaeota archaeon]|nr:hypothetical protein [Candidatus Woesearchaeota archaeon]